MALDTERCVMDLGYDRDTAIARRLRTASVVASFCPDRMQAAASGHDMPRR